MKTALYRYSTPNIGDDFQSYVMAGIVGAPDLWIDRDQASRYSGDPCRLIANAYMAIEAFPISAAIQPHFVAIHLGGMEKKIEPDKLAYLKENAASVGPVGCRDRETLQYLDRLEVPSYFAGCPTCLCEPVAGVEAEDLIVFADVDPMMFGKLSRQQPVHWITQRVAESAHSARQAICADRLRLFSRARLIVTSRIHVALPCLGMGKPVIFVRQKIIAPARLGALPEGFKTYPSGDPQLWNMELRPEHHLFDIGDYRRHVRAALRNRLPGSVL